MTTRETVRRIRAWESGGPKPRFSTLEFRVNKKRDCFGLVFIRMAGETRPWSVMAGTLDSEPKFFFAPEPRDRLSVNKIVDEAADSLLSFMNSWLQSQTASTIPQFWFPDETHIDMLHNIEYAYSREKKIGEKRPKRSGFGRLAGWLFREHQLKGQQTAIVCNRVIAESWTIPVEDTRQAHLGHTLAWLKGKGDLMQTMQEANLAIEKRVGITLNPDIERRSLEKPVKTLQEGSDSEKEAAVKTIRKILLEESQRRWDLMLEAYSVLSSDARLENKGVVKLVDNSRQRLLTNYARIEDGIKDELSSTPAFVPHPETDRDPAAAASAYIVMNKAEELWLDTLVDDDAERLHDMIETGDAFAGIIEQVTPLSAKSLAAFWLIRATHVGPLRMKNGDEVRLVGPYAKSGFIEEILIDGGGEIQVMLSVNFGVKPSVGAPKPLDLPVNDRGWIGTAVSFVPKPFTGQDAKIKRIWEAKDSPGAWLTHSVPKREDPEPTPDDIGQIVDS